MKLIFGPLLIRPTWQSQPKPLTHFSASDIAFSKKCKIKSTNLSRKQAMLQETEGEKYKERNQKSCSQVQLPNKMHIMSKYNSQAEVLQQSFFLILPFFVRGTPQSIVSLSRISSISAGRHRLQKPSPFISSLVSRSRAIIEAEKKLFNNSNESIPFLF